MMHMQKSEERGAKSEMRSEGAVIALRLSLLAPRRPRRGFTLLEVLVAISLSLLLIAALYSGLNLYWRYSTVGHDDVERALLARALLRRIALDVRSAMFRAADTSASSGSSSQSSSSGQG